MLKRSRAAAPTQTPHAVPTITPDKKTATEKSSTKKR
jgi:hypothetical protein